MPASDLENALLQLYRPLSLRTENSCEPVAYWIDDVRIRSQAFQDAYADYAKWSGKQQKLSIAAPPLASAWAGNFSSTIVTYMHTPFPGDQVDENFVLADQYSYHK